MLRHENLVNNNRNGFGYPVLNSIYYMHPFIYYTHHIKLSEIGVNLTIILVYLVFKSGYRFGVWLVKWIKYDEMIHIHRTWINSKQLTNISWTSNIYCRNITISQQMKNMYEKWNTKKSTGNLEASNNHETWSFHNKVMSFVRIVHCY